MPKRRTVLSAVGAGSLSLLSGCSYFRSNNPLNNSLRLKIFWTPTSPSSYRFRLGSLSGDVAFIKTGKVDGEVNVADGEDNCSREDCIYKYKKVNDSVELSFSEGTSGYISFFGSRSSDSGETTVKELGRFHLEDENLEYLY